jgi:hypothetical protein
MASHNRTHASDRGKAVLDIPTVPTIGTATKYFDGATVAFTPSTKGGAATSYTVLSNPGSITATGATSPITISGLTLNTAYTFSIRANNAQGSSEYSSASNSITPTDPAPIEYLIVGGGGNGSNAGYYYGGGGGSGGRVRTDTAYAAPRGSALSITVGGGGSSSSFNSIVSESGYYGSNSNNAGGVGASTTAATSRAGTAGVSNSITGTATMYAGGGGAGAVNWPGTQPGAGVDGGGSGGYYGVNRAGVAGTANTGGGGGGGGIEDQGDGQYATGGGGAGGSGVVVIAYPSSVGAATIGSGLTYNEPTRTGYRVYRFTAGSGTITIPS